MEKQVRYKMYVDMVCSLGSKNYKYIVDMLRNTFYFYDFIICTILILINLDTGQVIVTDFLPPNINTMCA